MFCWHVSTGIDRFFIVAGDDDYHMSEFITEWKLEIDGNPHKVKYFFEEYWIGYSPREAGGK